MKLWIILVCTEKQVWMTVWKWGCVCVCVCVCVNTFKCFSTCLAVILSRRTRMLWLGMPLLYIKKKERKKEKSCNSFIASVCMCVCVNQSGALKNSPDRFIVFLGFFFYTLVSSRLLWPWGSKHNFSENPTFHQTHFPSGNNVWSQTLHLFHKLKRVFWNVFV